MFTRLALIGIFAAALCQGVALAEEWVGEGGKADSVKSMPARDFESARTAGIPLCVYFFDPSARINPRARYLELVLANAELRSRLKDFLCLRIRSDATDVKGWPADLREHATKSASIVLISTDSRQIITFDKNLQISNITPEIVGVACQSVLDYEKKAAALAAEKGNVGTLKKKDTKADDKALAAAVIEASKVPGLDAKEKRAAPKRKVASPVDE